MKMDKRSGGFRWQTLLLYAGFLGTGVGVALPGVLLPVFLLNWHLRDEQAGRLFLLAWAGSSLGALAVRGSLRTCLALGVRRSHWRRLDWPSATAQEPMR